MSYAGCVGPPSGTDQIRDLLPLHMANEVSADDHTLVESCLKTDRELVQMAEKSAAIELPDDIPIPLTTEDRREAS